MRKDVEDAFGIVKVRFQILKTGIRLHRVEATDKIWLMCCTLHNLLLEPDRLHEEWQSGIPSEWQRELVFHNTGDLVSHSPFALQRLNSLSYDDLRRFDSSGMGRGNHEWKHQALQNILDKTQCLETVAATLSAT